MQPGQLVAPIIVAIGVIVAAVAFAIVTTLLDTANSGAEMRMSRIEAALAAAADAEGAQQADIAALKADVTRLREDLSLVANRAPGATGVAPATGSSPDQIAPPTVSDTTLPDEDFETPPPTEALTEQMKLATTRFNRGITQPRNKTMMELLGPPRDSYSNDCQGVTNPRLKAMMETRTIGPITVTMLKPALDSLERVMVSLKETDPDIYAKLGTAGAFCARYIRGSTTSVSNHSWGTAVDLTLEGQLDGFADGGTQFGLVVLAEHFNAEGWYWGAVYKREDSMHFEVGEETLRAWAAEGKL